MNEYKEFNLKTNYEISLPIILPDEEIIFTYEYKNLKNKKGINRNYLILRHVYSKNLKSNLITDTAINKKWPLIGNRRKVSDQSENELREKYYTLYEWIKDSYYNEAATIPKFDMWYSFKDIVLDHALYNAYMKFGSDKMFSFVDN